MRKQTLSGPRAARNASTTTPADTFTVRLDPEAAKELADMCDEFRRVTPEAILCEVVSDAMKSAASPSLEPYRYELATCAAERAKAMRHPKWPAKLYPLSLSLDVVEAIRTGAKAAERSVDEYASEVLERVLAEMAVAKGGDR